MIYLKHHRELNQEINPPKHVEWLDINESESLERRIKIILPINVPSL